MVPGTRGIVLSSPSLIYLLAPPLAWVVAGGIKFAINSLRAQRLAFSAIGLGGIPSTHNTITATVAALIGLREGFDHAAFGVAFAFMLIVAIDAMDLRQKIGRQAEVIRDIAPDNAAAIRLRTRIGHTPVEVATGWLVGGLLAISLNWIAP